MAAYDQAARYAAKLEPIEFFDWLLPDDNPWQFRSWLDTRTVPLPGESDRVCDTVGEFWHSTSADEPPLAFVVEFKSAPSSLAFEQLCGYSIGVRAELRPQGDRRIKFQVATALVNLTGRRRQRQWRMTPGGLDGAGLTFKVILKNVAADHAGETLSLIAAGTLGRTILPWVALMEGGGEPTIIETWKQLAAAERDSRRRSDYAALALVFAELANSQEIWKHALEGWNMQESQQVLEWQAQAREEGREEGRTAGLRDAVCRVVETRFPSEAEELRSAIESQNDADILADWIQFALTAENPEDLRSWLNGAAG